MILLLAIILFIIFLIYSIKPRREEYTLEGLKLSWKNKASIEGVVTKWIVTLKDSSGNVIHTYENNESKNLKNFTDVTMNIVNKKEFDDKIIGDNTLELYYNEVKPDNKLYTKTVTFTEEDFGGVALDMSKLEEVDIPRPPTFSYEFIMNKKNQTLGIHVGWIKLDGVLATKEQTTIHKPPNRNNNSNHMFTDNNNYSSWNANGHNVGDKIFTIESDKQIEKIDISYGRPRYGPGWIIKENGVTKITETSNRGNNMTPNPVVYTYNIKDGTSSPPPITEIPHQIDSGADGWCIPNTNTVHQDVPGCGRICSSWEYVGRKDKNSWGLWGGNQNGIDCPDAKLDQVWKLTGGSTSGRPNRELAVGNYSESEGLPDEIYMIGGKDGKYCAVDSDIIKCNYVPNSFDSLEKFKLTKNSNGTYSFKGGNKYCADEDNRIICNRGGIGGWERFKINKNSDGTYSLKGGKGGKYCADEGNTIKCNRGGIGSWERFKIGKYNKPSLSLRAGNSGAHDDGGGKVYFMDRHNIECGSDALNGFGLIRQPGGRTQYNYLCLKPGNLKTHDKRTGSDWQGHNNGNVNSALYLDRHTINCNNKPITQFRLHRDGDKKVYYKYKCGNVSTQNNACRETSTPWNQESDSVHYLDRHYAKCNPDEYMTKFGLVRDGKGNFRYNFRCCKKN